MPDVTMPDGTVVQNVPEGTTQSELKERYLKSFPEFTLPTNRFKDSLKVAAGLFTTPDLNSRVDIIRKALPDATVTPFGDNAIIEVDGKKMVLNKPGLSQADVADFGSSLIKFLPAGKAAQAASGAGKLAAVGVGAVASGATSVAEDLAAGLQGSEQGVIGQKVALDTALGGGAEVLQPLVGRVIKFGKTLFKTPGAVVDGRLTESGRAMLRESGIDPKEFRQTLIKVVNEQGEEALDATPDQIAALVRQSEADDLGVSLTKGQADQNFAQLSREDTLRTTDITTRAGDTLRAFDERQVSQLSDASRVIQGGVADGISGNSIDDVGDSLLNSLKTAHRTAQREVDEAYAAARELDGSFSPESVLDMTRSIRRSLSDEIVTKDLHPATSTALERMGKLSSILQNPNARPKAFTIRRMEAMRRQANNLISSAKNPDDKRLMVKVKKALDGWMDEAIDTAAFSGDTQALAALKKARQKRVDAGIFEKGTKWDTPGGIVENLLNKDVTGREAVNYIFGASALGRKQGVTATVKRLKEILPPEQFNTVREAAWLRVVEKAYQGGQFSRAKALTSIDDALNGNGAAAMKALFSPEQIAQIRKFRRVIATTVTPKDATGPSGTPRKLGQMFQQLGQSLGLTASMATQNPVVALLAFTPQARRALDFRAAREAARGFQLPAQRAAAVSAAGVATGRELTDDELTSDDQ